MTLGRLFEICDRHGLALSVDRITTGTELAGFHQFEFVGDADKLHAAAKLIRSEWGVNAEFVKVAHVDNPGHDEHGKPFLSVNTFWCVA